MFVSETPASGHKGISSRLSNYQISLTHCKFSDVRNRHRHRIWLDVVVIGNHQMSYLFYRKYLCASNFIQHYLENAQAVLPDIHPYVPSFTFFHPQSVALQVLKVWNWNDSFSLFAYIVPVVEISLSFTISPNSSFIYILTKEFIMWFTIWTATSPLFVSSHYLFSQTWLTSLPNQNPIISLHIALTYSRTSSSDTPKQIQSYRIFLLHLTQLQIHLVAPYLLHCRVFANLVNIRRDSVFLSFLHFNCLHCHKGSPGNHGRRPSKFRDTKLATV